MMGMIKMSGGPFQGSVGVPWALLNAKKQGKNRVGFII